MSEQLYYITKKTSETGKRFAEIEKKQELCFNAQKAFAKKYGFKAWRGAHWAAWGGFSSLCEPTVELDKKTWGRGAEPGEYMPKASSISGSIIRDEIKELPKITWAELNACVGFKSDMFKCIRFSFGDKEYYGFTVNAQWKFTPPEDCEEVTYTRYKNLSKPAKP